jgi:penicillin-binding protein 2
MRDYPSNVATHLIGYLGEVNLEKTKEDPYYTKGDLTGVSGVEAQPQHDILLPKLVRALHYLCYLV